MLTQSKLYKTKLTVGPRLQKLLESGTGYDLLWSENYPDQEEPTNDGRGRFQHTREWIETASLEALMDLWCRGQNLMGFAGSILRVVDVLKKVVKK